MDIVMRLVANLIGGLWRKSANKKRQNNVNAVAEEMGLEFLPHVNMLHEFEGSDLSITAGSNKYCINCFGGDAAGIEFKVFEFNFVTGAGKNQNLHSQTVCCINMGHSCLPDFQVKQKGFFSKLFGKPVNTFEIQDEVFEKNFWLTSTEPSIARTLFNQEVKAWVHANDWSVESCKGRLLIYKAGTVVNHASLKNFLTGSLELMAKLEDAQSNPAPQFLNQTVQTNPSGSQLV